jgi:hypothetical protein
MVDYRGSDARLRGQPENERRRGNSGISTFLGLGGELFGLTNLLSQGAQ